MNKRSAKRFLLLSAFALGLCGVAHAEDVGDQGNGYHPTDPVESAVLGNLMEAGLSNAASSNALDVLMKKTPGRCLDLARELLAHKIAGDDAVSATEKACALTADSAQWQNHTEELRTSTASALSEDEDHQKLATETVGTLTGEWVVNPDPVIGAPILNFSVAGENLLGISWVPPESRSSPQQALLYVIIPGKYFDCSARAADLLLSDGGQLHLEGDGRCLPNRGSASNTGVFLTFPRGSDGQIGDKRYLRKVASELAKGAFPTAVIYGAQKIDLTGGNPERAIAEYERDIDPSLNPDFYEKMGVK